jgi:hypothetical protein
MKRSNKLPTGGGLQTGGSKLPAGSTKSLLKPGGGLQSGGGMKGVVNDDEAYDEMFFETITKSNKLSAVKTANRKLAELNSKIASAKIANP